VPRQRKLFQKLGLVCLALFTTFLCAGSSTRASAVCAYHFEGVCLTEEEIVWSLYDFDPQDLQDAHRVVSSLIQRIESGETSFVFEYDDRKIALEATDSGDYQTSGSFSVDLESAVIGTIKTDNDYAETYHEFLHARQFIRMLELVENKGLKDSEIVLATATAFYWYNTQLPQDKQMMLEWVVNWEDCRYQMEHDERLRTICTSWQPYLADHDIFRQAAPRWNSPRQKEWSDFVISYYSMDLP